MQTVEDNMVLLHYEEKQKVKQGNRQHLADPPVTPSSHEGEELTRAMDRGL